MPISPNMGLNVPVPTVTPGPQYAQDISGNFNVIDSHNHSAGSGVAVPFSGLAADQDLSAGGYSIFNLKTATLNNLSVSPSLSGSLYMLGNNLFFKDGSGAFDVQITNGASLSGAAGTISGLPSGTASAAYLSGSGTFRFQSATNTAATMDVGPIVLRKTSALSNSITIAPNAGLASNYSLTLPAALPASTSLVQSDTSGNLSFISTAFILPAGVMMMFAGTAIPTGWLACDGSVVSQSTYAALFAVIGTAFDTGGEGAGNFRLPDLTRRTAVGAGGIGTAVLGNVVGNSGGAESVTLAVSEIPSHNHGGATGSSTVGSQRNVSGSLTSGSNAVSANATFTSSTLNNSDHTHTISSQGGGGAHNNIQPSLVVNYIIKT